MNAKRLAFAAALLTCAGLTACEDDKPKVDLAPTSTALKADKPKAAGTQKFVVDKASAKVSFLMEAPVEKIRGKVDGTGSGELNIDLSDLTKTTGLVNKLHRPGL